MNIEDFQVIENSTDLHHKRGFSSHDMIVRATQMQQGHEPCYLTDKRYTCDEICEWSASCKMLRAVWLR